MCNNISFTSCDRKSKKLNWSYVWMDGWMDGWICLYTPPVCLTAKCAVRFFKKIFYSLVQQTTFVTSETHAKFRFRCQTWLRADEVTTADFLSRNSWSINLGSERWVTWHPDVLSLPSPLYTPGSTGAHPLRHPARRGKGVLEGSAVC